MPKANLKLDEEALEVDIGEYKHAEDNPYTWPYFPSINISLSESAATSTSRVASPISSSLDPSPSPSPWYTGTPPVQPKITAYLGSLRGHEKESVSSLGHVSSSSSLSGLGAGSGGKLSLASD